VESGPYQVAVRQLDYKIEGKKTQRSQTSDRRALSSTPASKRKASSSSPVSQPSISISGIARNTSGTETERTKRRRTHRKGSLRTNLPDLNTMLKHSNGYKKKANCEQDGSDVKSSASKPNRLVTLGSHLPSNVTDHGIVVEKGSVKVSNGRKGKKKKNEASNGDLNGITAMHAKGSHTYGIKSIVGPDDMISINSGRLNFSKHEILRLISQFLASSGFERISDILQNSSGVIANGPDVLQLQSQIQAGEWDTAMATVKTIFSLEEKESQSVDSPSKMNYVLYLLCKEKFVHLIYMNLSGIDGRGDCLEKATSCLRDQLEPLVKKAFKFHEVEPNLSELCRLFLCSQGSDIHGYGTKWHRTAEEREHLIREILSYLPYGSFVQDHQLLHLLQSACQPGLVNGSGKVPLLSLSSKGDNMRPSDSVHKSPVSEYLPSTNVQVMFHHTGEVWTVEFSNSGKWLASGGKDGMICLFSFKSEQVKASEQGTSTETKTSARSTNDLSQKVKQGRMNQDVEGDSVGTGPLSFQGFVMPNFSVKCIKWSPDDNHLIASYSNSTLISVWKIGGSNLFDSLKDIHAKRRISSLEWCGDSRRFFACGEYKSIFMFDLSGQLLHEWKSLPVHDMKRLNIHEQECLVLASSSPSVQRVQILEIRSGKSQHDSENLSTLDEAYDQTGKQLETVVTASKNENPIKLRFRHGYGQEVIRTKDDGDFYSSLSLPKVSKPVTCLSVSAETETVIGNILNDCLYEWEAKTGKLIRVFRGIKSGRQICRPCKYNDTYLACGSVDGSIKIWNCNEMEKILSESSWKERSRASVVNSVCVQIDPLKSLEGHTSGVNQVVFSPANPGVIVSCGDDGTIRVWTRGHQTEGFLNTVRLTSRRRYKDRVPKHKYFTRVLLNNLERSISEGERSEDDAEDSDDNSSEQSDDDFDDDNEDDSEV